MAGEDICEWFISCSIVAFLGRTSCISHETLGFDALGNVVNYKYNEMMTAEEISDRSTKLVTFMDLAGHRRYMRTTVQALSGYSPHYAMLVVSAGSGCNDTTEEHLAIVRALDMPFFILITKTDITSPDATVQELRTLLTNIGCRKVPFVVTNTDEAISAGSNQVSENIVPIFCVSNVTGTGLNLVTKFLYVLSPGISNAEKDRLELEPCEFQIDEIFRVTDVGPVVGGLLVQGVLTENMPMKIGPLPDGSFHAVTVHTIHRNKAPCRVVRAGQSASLSFTPMQELPSLRSGMVLLSDSGNIDEPYGTYFFQVSSDGMCYNEISIEHGIYVFRPRYLCCSTRPLYMLAFRPRCTSAAFARRRSYAASWAARSWVRMTLPR